jgi:lipopolysaccharide assembly LptE-like protein
MQFHKKIFFSIIAVAAFAFTCLIGSNCKVNYGFKEKSFPIPDSVKTVNIHIIENHARYLNSQLSPRLTERLRLKITNLTHLTQTNSDNAHWDVSGQITDYSVSTSGVSDKQVSINRLTISVVMLLDRKNPDLQDNPVTVTHSFDFSANLTLQQAEGQLMDEIVRQMTDEIYNNLFSRW